MMQADDRVLQLVTQKLQERIDGISDSLRSGAAKDFADYREMCGVVRGLGLAQMEVSDLLRKLKEIENDN